MGDTTALAVVASSAITALVDGIRARGYEVLGPTRRDGAIVYDEIESASEFPIGYSDTQEPGAYRLQRRSDGAFFQFASTAQSWKRFLFPPTTSLVRVERDADGIRFESVKPPNTKLAFVGARACDLKALAVLDGVFSHDGTSEPGYFARKKKLFIVAVQCGRPASTCFCASMGSGPKAEKGYDLALTELLDGEHRFLVETGSRAGAKVLADLESRPADEADMTAAEAVWQKSEQSMGRSLDPEEAAKALYARLDDAKWEETAERCLACGNCTMACPTCFCSTVEEISDLSGESAERVRRWDSCFSQEYSYIHGGSVRKSGAARYRQWINHKLAYWHDQFGTSGCVGCGRCIVWCPVGIDITAEARGTHTIPLKEGGNNGGALA